MRGCASSTVACGRTGAASAPASSCSAAAVARAACPPPQRRSGRIERFASCLQTTFSLYPYSCTPCSVCVHPCVCMYVHGGSGEPVRPASLLLPCSVPRTRRRRFIELELLVVCNAPRASPGTPCGDPADLRPSLAPPPRLLDALLWRCADGRVGTSARGPPVCSTCARISAKLRMRRGAPPCVWSGGLCEYAPAPAWHTPPGTYQHAIVVLVQRIERHLCTQNV